MNRGFVNVGRLKEGTSNSFANRDGGKGAEVREKNWEIGGETLSKKHLAQRTGILATPRHVGDPSPGGWEWEKRERLIQGSSSASPPGEW